MKSNICPSRDSADTMCLFAVFRLLDSPDHWEGVS